MKKVVSKKVIVIAIAVIIVAIIGIAWWYMETSKPKIIKLTAWKWGSDETIDPKLHEIIDMWNKEHPNTQIELVIFPELSEAEFITKVEHATEAGKGPDLIHGSDVLLAVLAFDGYLEPVPDDVLSVIKQYIPESYISMLKWWGPDGVKRVYGATFTENGPKVLFVNEYHLQEAGYPADWCPADWDELVDASIKMTKRKPDGTLERAGIYIRASGHVGGIFDKFEPFFRSAGGKLLWCEGGKWKTDINSEAGLRAVQLYLDLLYKYKVYEIGFPGDATAFAKEQNSMLPAREAWVISYLHVTSEKFKGPKGFHACPIPPYKKGMPSKTSSHMHGFTVNAKISDERKKVAWEFIKWLTRNVEARKKISVEIANWIPYKDIINLPPFDNPVYQQMTEIAIETSGSRIYHPKMGLIHNAAGKWLQLIFSQQIDPERGLDEAAKEILEIANTCPCKGEG